MTSGAASLAKTSFSLQNADRLDFPVLISVPHAGREYPPELTDNLKVPGSCLLRLEDRYVDRLAGPAIERGLTTLVAHRPRAWIDLNRNRNEIDPEMIDGISEMSLPQRSRKVRGGLGLVPKRLTGSGDLWRHNWQWRDILTRIENDHEPYHQAVHHQLMRLKQKFSRAILLDLHSMPPLGKDETKHPKIVIGDRFGRSSAAVFSDLAARLFERAGLPVQLNSPYSGGYLLERHGNPTENIHAIQLEVDRSCYLDASLREPSPNMPKIADQVLELALLLTDEAAGGSMLEAAE